VQNRETSIRCKLQWESLNTPSSSSVGCSFWRVLFCSLFALYMFCMFWQASKKSKMFYKTCMLCDPWALANSWLACCINLEPFQTHDLHVALTLSPFEPMTCMLRYPWALQNPWLACCVILNANEIFFNFVMSLKWQSSITRFSQIWLHTRYERRKKTQNPSIVFATYWKLP